MFCIKCGKEINDNDKFCQYCGSPIEREGEEHLDISKDMEMMEEEYGEVHDEQVSKTKNRKKWVIPVCIAVGVVALAGTGVFAMNMLKAEKKEPKKEIAKEEKELEATYPKEITLDGEVQNKVTELLDLLCKMDTSGSSHNFATNTTIDGDFASRFLLDSIWFEVPFADGKPVEGWSVSEEIVKNYLKTSIDMDDFTKDWASISDGMVVSQGVQVTGTYGNDTPQITKVIQLSETDIQVLGSANYIPEFLTDSPYTVEFDVILTVNPDSMWGGYTLKEIKNWKEVVKNSSESQGDTISAEDKQKLTDFLFLLGEIDYRDYTDVRDLYMNQKDIFGCSFLFYSMYHNLELLEDTYNVVDYDDYWEMREEQVDAYLLDSVGSSEFVGENVISASEGFLCFAKGDPPYVRQVRDVNIENITSSSNSSICIQGSMNYEDLEKETKFPVSYQITMRKNTRSIWGGYTLESIDKWEKQNIQEYEEPEVAFGDYLNFLTDAVNSGDYTGAEKVMLRGSALYKEQEKLVKRLYGKNTKEELLTWNILDKEQIDETHVRLISEEAIQVTYGDGTSKELYQSYAYTCELTEDGWLFTSLSAVE